MVASHFINQRGIRRYFREKHNVMCGAPAMTELDKCVHDYLDEIFDKVDGKGVKVENVRDVFFPFSEIVEPIKKPREKTLG